MSTVKNYPQHYRDLQICMKQLSEANPSSMKGFAALHKGAMQEGALGTKEKELIALGIAIAVNCDGCIAYHTVAALKAGSTEQEISEAIGVAVLMGGGPAAIYGAQAFEALKQFQANPKDWM